MRRAIYIGNGFRKEFPECWIEDHGFISSSELHYGMTGTVFQNGRKWDFRPDGLNLCHLINQKDLYFLKDTRRITDKAEIKKVMHEYMYHPFQMNPSFITTVFTREQRPGGIIYEGVRPIGACTDINFNVTYTLANSDSGYQRPIAIVRLDKIEYIEV